MTVNNLTQLLTVSGPLVVMAATFLWQVILVQPKEKDKQDALIEKVASVIAENTEVIRETKSIHKDMEKTLIEIKSDIKELKNSTDLTSVYTMLEKLESKIDQLGK